MKRKASLPDAQQHRSKKQIIEQLDLGFLSHKGWAHALGTVADAVQVDDLRISADWFSNLALLIDFLTKNIFSCL